jgi:hypothetical protein
VLLVVIPAVVSLILALILLSRPSLAADHNASI